MEEINQGKKITKSEQTRQKIEASFLELMTTKPWDKITVKELCSNIGITRGTFYQYYSDIYELMERLQLRLLNDFNTRYEALYTEGQTPIQIERFLEDFNTDAPPMLICWFDFCMDNRKEITALLDTNYGDAYFVNKLKKQLVKYVQYLMDMDGQPNDELRVYFTKVFTELHFLAAKTWLEYDDENNYMSAEEIVILLNTMRIGAGYTSYKLAIEKRNNS